LHPLGFLIAGHAVFLIIVFTRLIFPDLLSLPARLIARKVAQGDAA
jgi:branched-chain amino acid transport system permease protein